MALVNILTWSDIMTVNGTGPCSTLFVVYIYFQVIRRTIIKVAKMSINAINSI